MDSHYVNYKQFEPHRLTLAGAQTKNSKANPSQNKPAAAYQTADFNYLYLLPDGKEIKNTFCIEWATMKFYGIQPPDPTKTNSNSTQTKANLDKNNQEIQECLKVADVVHARMIDLICEPTMKAALKAKNIDAQSAKATGANFKKLFYYPEDKTTGEVDHNKNPTQYFKLNSYESSKTKFLAYDENKKIIEIPWNIMEKADYVGKPLIKYTHIYSNGSNVSAQHYMISMVIEDLKLRGSDHIQKNTLNAMVETNPDLINKISTGLATIKEKLDQMSVNGPTRTKHDDSKKFEPLQSMSVPLNQQTVPVQSSQTQTMPPYSQAPQSQPVQSPPSLNNFMRSGPTQTYSGNINQPDGQHQPDFQQAQMNQQQQYQGANIPNQQYQFAGQQNQPIVNQGQPIPNMNQMPAVAQQNQPIPQAQPFNMPMAGQFNPAMLNNLAGRITT